MITSTRSGFADRLQSISRWASAATIAFGCIVLVGWFFNVPVVKSVWPGLNSMKANTALCFVLCGLALWLLQPRPTPNALTRYAALACAGLVTIIGLATLSQYIFGWDLHIDQLLFRDTTPSSITLFPGRMVPASTLIFILFGLALLTAHHHRLYKFGEWATTGASVIALAAFIGLLYDAGNPSDLYLITLYRGIALQTVAGAVLFSIGLLCLRKDQGLIAIFVRETPGGKMARRLLPMVISLPIFISLLYLIGERVGLYPNDFGMTINTITTIAALVIVIWQNARALDRSDLIRRQSEQALRENEDKFRYIFDYSPVAKSITRLSGQIEVNQAFCEMLGYSQKELQGEAWQQITHPDDVQSSQQALDSVASGENVSAHFSKRYIHKNGNVVWAEIRSTVRRDNEGRSLYFLTSVIDVTERKRSEQALQIYTAKLEQSNRDLQEFAYIASHDLQEPLRKVQAFSDRLATKYADKFDETGHDYLNRMRDASQRMQVLINDLLTLSRVATSAQPFSAVDLNVLAQEVLSNLENQIERAEGRVEVGELPRIEADPIQIRQLMQNLIGNALKFHPPERHPLITVSAKVEGVNCQISIEDNGIGFDTQYLDRIFKPFQRLHSREEYEGSGMGLAICRRIVERHGGMITATSTLGEGATFILTLPMQQPEEKHNAKA